MEGPNGKEDEIKPVGIQGGIILREQLATSKDPRATIKQFVSMNSLRTPSCTPAHELLDLIGFTRAAQHEGILSKLKDRMLSRIEGLSQDKQLALLERCFPYISVPELREVPLHLFSALPRIPVSYLNTLAQSPDIFAELPIAVKRQVWAADAGHGLSGLSHRIANAS